MEIAKLEATQNREMLFHIFRRADKYLWHQDIEPGLPRFHIFVNFLFLKLMHERQQDGFWESLKAAPSKVEYLNKVIIPALQAQYGAQDVFFETQTLHEVIAQKIMAILDSYHLSSVDSDVMGDAYEHFLKTQNASKQSLGQYFTPRRLARVMVSLVSPTRHDTVYDPFCGAGGLLLEASKHVKGSNLPDGKAVFFGKDASPHAARIAKMNAILHWGGHDGIELANNSLQHPIHGQYSIGLTNVPFAKDPRNYPYNHLYENGLARKNTDVLSIFHLFRSIQEGGRMAAIVPEGFLIGKERADARRFLTDKADLKLVASLPHGIFLPYTNVKTALIYLDNIHCPKQEGHFWYADLDNPNSLEALHGKSFHGASEESLIKLGYAKIPFEKLRQNQESWMGRQYQETSSACSPYPLVPLGKLVTFVQTGFSHKAAEYSSNGVPFFTLQSIKTGFLSNQGTQFLKQGTKTREKSACAEGDILVALTDRNTRTPILGRAALVDQKGVYSGDLAKVEIKAKELVSGDYLYYVFKGEGYAKEIKKFAAGTIIKSISLDNMASIKIPLPSLSVQKEIVQELNQYGKMIMAQHEVARFLEQKCGEKLGGLWVKDRGSRQNRK